MSSAPETVVEIITIGREILDGRVIDTNSSYLGEKLSERGLCPRYAQRVDDQMERILEAFAVAARRSQVILCTGGLGPTTDDLTAEAFAKFLGETPYENPDALRMVEDAFLRMKRPMGTVQKKQAVLAPSCVPLLNPVGTAPGFKKTSATHRWYFVPGVPREMKAIFENFILPELPTPAGKFTKYTWKTQFTSEGELQARITREVGAAPENFELCYRTRMPENHVSLLGLVRGPDEARTFADYRDKLDPILAMDAYYAGAEENPPELEDCVIAEARRTGHSITPVESCSGGLIAHRLTNVSGASQVLWNAFLTYDNQAKIRLGVPAEIFTRVGAVSEDCAAAMARAGVAQAEALGLKRALSISTTGIAGPEGGSVEKPVGLCFVCLAGPGGSIIDQEKVQARPGLTREDYKRIFAQKALTLALKFLRTQ